MTTLKEELKKYEFTDFEDDAPIVSDMFHKDDIIKAINAVLDDYKNTVTQEPGDPDVKDWFYHAIREIKERIK